MSKTDKYSLQELLIDHILPALVFIYLLGDRAQRIAGDLQYIRIFPLLLPEEIISFILVAIMVVLFFVRRPAILRTGSAFAGIVALSGTFLLTIPLPLTESYVYPSMALQIVSGILILAGTVFSIISLSWLGRCFGIRPDVRGLVTSGPYRWIRHPLYLGEFVVSFGWVLLRLSPFMAVVFILWCALQYYRMLIEETALSAAFPEYETYRQSTYRVIPFIH